ncbi:MAG: tetratricopeptide repeat protein [Anderseniella sp.]|jgi:tetratricopeptide (TPR) repeat protein|nr:tetratricopeptide repeat protein [Anderseniella sp.]
MTTNKISTSATAHKPATGEIEQLMQKMQQTRSPADAEALARKAVSLKPERAELHLALATALHMQGKAREAEAAYGECLKRDRKNVRALINLGSLQVDGGQPAAAIKALDGALYLSPDNAEALFHKGRGLGRMGEAGEALQIFDELAKKQPGNVEVLKFLALCHMDIGHKTEAAKVLSRAAELAPDDKAIQSAMQKLSN